MAYNTNAVNLYCFLPAESKYDGFLNTGSGILPFSNAFPSPQHIPVSNGSGDGNGILNFTSQGGDRGFYDQSHFTTSNIKAFGKFKGSDVFSKVFGDDAEDVLFIGATKVFQSDPSQVAAAIGLKNEDVNTYSGSAYGIELITFNQDIGSFVEDHIYLILTAAADGVQGYASPFSQADATNVGSEYADWIFDLGLFTDIQLRADQSFGILCHKDKSGNDYQISVVSSLFVEQTFNIEAHPTNTNGLRVFAPKIANVDQVAVGVWGYQDFSNYSLSGLVAAQGTEWLDVSQLNLIDDLKGHVGMVNKQIDSVEEFFGQYGYQQGSFGTMNDDQFRDKTIFKISQTTATSVIVNIDEQGLPENFLGDFVIINGVQYDVGTYFESGAFNDNDSGRTSWSWSGASTPDSGLSSEENNTVPIVFEFTPTGKSKVITAAGTIFAISDTLPSTNDQAGFEALAYTDIAELVDGGQGGKTFAKVDFSPLQEREVLSIKGSFDQGIRTLQLGRDVTDAGQVLLLAGLEVDDPYSFRITFQNGDVMYATATVDSYTDDINTIDTIVGATVSIAQRELSVRVNSGDVNNGVLTASIDFEGLTYDTDNTFTATQASTDGDGSGVEFTVTILAGVIDSIDSVDLAGSGYDIGDLITLDIAGSTPATPAVLAVVTLGTPT